MRIHKTKRLKATEVLIKVWLVALITAILCFAGCSAQSQCLEFSANGTEVLCHQGETFTSYDGCGTEQNYAQCVSFSVEMDPFQLIIDGEQYFTFNPGNVVCTNFWIEDSWGDVMVSTSCGVITCQEDYNLELSLPLGEYTLFIASVGVPVVQEYMEGCVTVTILAGFLGLSVGEHERTLVNNNGSLLILYRGRYYDMMGRLVTIKKFQ